MNTTLMKEYTYKIVDEYVFIKKVYFDYTNERVYINLLVYTKAYQSDMEYVLDYMNPTRFNEVAEQAIKNFLNKRNIFNY